MWSNFEENVREILEILQIYPKHIPKTFWGSSKERGQGLCIWWKFLENLNENPKKIKEKCGENLKEISLEFDKNLWKISEKSNVLRKYKEIWGKCRRNTIQYSSKGGSEFGKSEILIEFKGEWKTF